MKTQPRYANWLMLVVFLLGSLLESNAWYSPSQQRWINRDPIGEQGGLNQYGFVGNNPVSWWDALGTQTKGVPQNTPMRFYCEAVKQHPENKWLPCACKVSGEINMLIAGLYVTGPFVDDPPMAGKIIRWFDCTRSCILRKFKEFYKVYDKGANKSVVNLTPQWDKACNKCIGKPEAISAKECCEAMVDAEQSALEDCKSECGEFPGNPKALPIPGFSGDFSKLDDRIKYGRKRCCEDKGK